MVTVLVETSVLVDVLRQYSPAQQWMSNQTDLGVPSAVRLEVVAGAGNKIKQQQALNLLKELETVENISSDFVWAEAQLLHYQLSHSVGMMDCLIAAASHRLQIPLYTRNLKHFTPLLGNLEKNPY